MSTPSMHYNKQNDRTKALLPPNEEARLRDLKMQRRKLNGTKKPGLFTKKITVEPPIPPEQTNVQELMAANLVYTDSLKRWIGELEQMVSALITKNDGLQAQNHRLREQNQYLREQLEQRGYENELLKSRPMSSTRGSLFGMLYESVQAPTIIQAELFETEGLPEAIYLKCHCDNNTNFRAYYLSMLQHECGRNQLRQLLQQLRLDDTYHLLPIMQDNEFWVRIAQNFLTILDNNQLPEAIDFMQYLESCSLVDLIFISALRSRVEFLTDGCHDKPLENVQLYTALANHFGIQFEQQKTINYDIYRFWCSKYEFQVILTDRNEHIVKFIEVEQSEGQSLGERIEVRSNRYIEQQPSLNGGENLGTQLSQMTPNNDSETYSAFKPIGIIGARRLEFDEECSVVRDFDYSPNLD